MWFVILIFLQFILMVKHNKQITKWTNKEIEKLNLPLLKEAHKQVLSFFNSPYYPEIIKEAEIDLFHGDFKILGNKTRYKKFFAEYINSLILSICLILKSKCPNDIWWILTSRYLAYEYEMYVLRQPKTR